MSTQQRQHPRPHARSQQARPQMAQRPARRLPPARRLDYILIPAPLDLSLSSLSSLSEKSPLPAIIVTPSSPTRGFRSLPSGLGGESEGGEGTYGNGNGGEGYGGEGEGYKGEGEYNYSIAFMVQPPKPSVFERTAGKVKATMGSVRESIAKVGLRTRPMAWSWRRGDGYAPIALPISAPPTQTEFAIPTYPSSSSGSGEYYAEGKEKKRTNKVLVVLTAVFVLVFCHMLAHFFTRASLPAGVGAFRSASPASLDLASSSPVLPSTIDLSSASSNVLPSTSNIVDAAVANGGVTAGVAGGAPGGEKSKAYFAYMAKLEVKQWLAWAVGGGRK